MSKPAFSSNPAPVNYAQAASKARSGASTPSAALSTASAPSRQPNAVAVNGQTTLVAAGDGVVVSKPAAAPTPAASINFGSLNDSSATLSSSPAQPSQIGNHLQPGGKPTFGTIPSTSVAPTSGVEAPSKPAVAAGAVSPAPGAPPTAAAPVKKLDFNSFFQSGGGGSGSAAGSAPVSGPPSEAPSTSSSAAPTPAMPTTALPEHQRRPSTYEASIGSNTSSPRPPSAILSPPTFPQQGFQQHHGALPAAARPFSPGGPYAQQGNMMFVPPNYAQQKPGAGGFVVPQGYPNGAPRQMYGVPAAQAGRPGQQRYNSSQAPTSPRLPAGALPQQYQYGYPQQWYGNGQYPGFYQGYAPPYAAAPSPFMVPQQAHQGQSGSPAASVNGSASPAPPRAATASPAPSALSASATSTVAPPSTATTPAASVSSVKPNPTANEFSMPRDFKKAETGSRRIEIKKPPSKAIPIVKPPAAAASASSAKPATVAATETSAPSAAIPIVAPAASVTPASAPASAPANNDKAAAEAAETQEEQKAKAAREAAEAEKERAAKQDAEAKAVAAAEAEKRVAEQAAETARLEKLRLEDESAKADAEKKAKEEAAAREAEAAAAAKKAEQAVEEEAAAKPEQKAPALVDASAPQGEPADMPAIAEADAKDEMSSSSAARFKPLHRPIHDEEKPRGAAEEASAPPSEAPSRAPSPPAALEIPAKRTGPSPLTTAQPLKALDEITYPEGIVGPSSALNAKAAPGRFRYDRNFLEQFQNLCQERPEGMPDAETLGMQDEYSNQTPGTPRSGSSRFGRGSGAMPPPPMRQPSMGMGGRGMPAMGNFGAPAKSSSDRFNQATAQLAMGGFNSGPGKGFGRTPSQQTGSRSGSKRGNVRNASHAGGPRQSGGPPVQYSLDGQPVAPLVKTDNAWSDQINKSRAGAKQDDTSPDMVQRKVKALLNKLTVDNFPSISKQILAWADKSKDETDGRILRQVIQLIFEKATDEASWSTMYARLCRMLQDTVSADVRDHSLKDANNSPVGGGTLFRKYLLNRCQEDYEKGWANRDTMTAAAASKAAEDEAKKAANDKAEADKEAKGDEKAEPKEAEILSDEYYAAQKAKRQGLGLVKFIGELFKLSMLTARIMHNCVQKLLRDLENPEEEDVESLCRLLTTVGPLLDGTNANTEQSQKASQVMKIYFERLEQLRKNEKLSSRIRFMIQDLAELRANGWQGRTEASGPKTIQEIHADAARQQAEESRRAASGGRGLPPRMGEPLPRGGSRGGRERSGPDGWSTISPAAPPARPSKAGDLKGFGQMRTSSASGAPTTFGPSGAFAIKGRASKDAPAPETPRQNAFAALENAEAAESETSSRPRLQLAPRTLPIEGEEGKDDEGAEQGEVQEGEGAAAPAMDEAAIKRSIDNSIKEFFELKDFDEAVLACQQLPEKAKQDFVAGLALKVIDMREDAVDRMCELFERFLDDEALTSAELGDGLRPLLKDLDDLGADAPKAFLHAAKLLRTADLSEEDVTRLAEVMESIEGDDDEARQEVRDRLLEEWRKQAPTEA